MDVRPLGNTGLEVTPLGLGMAALGRPGYINLGHATDMDRGTDPAAMEVHAHTVLDEAFRLGMRYFDAARSYGNGEAFLGRWWRRRCPTPDAVTISSKWGYTYTADWRIDAEVHEVKSHDFKTLERQIGETKEALGGLPHLYQIHSATFESGVLGNAQVLARLAVLKREGVAIGLTLSGANQAEVLARAHDIVLDGRPVFDCVQATWNLLEPSVGSMLTAVRADGMGVIVKEALANGRLTDRAADSAFAPKLTALRAEARRLGTTLDALALAAAVAQPWADVVLSGAASIDHIRSNAAALTVAWDGAARDALSSLAEEPAEYWRTRSALAWN